MSTARRFHPTRGRAAGFTLIELMIGMVIAMIGVIIMMQVVINSEERNRTTSGGNEALSSGAVTLHLLQRDLMQAGYGLNALRLLGCNLTIPTGATLPIAPLAINPDVGLVPAADTSTDRLLVMYGNDDGQPEGNTINSVAGNSYAAQSPSAFSVGDYVIGAPDSCAGGLTLARVTAVDAANVTVNTADPSATVLYNLGQQPRIAAYAVRNGSLTVCDYLSADCRTNNATTYVAITGNIPSLRAVYGRDTTAGAMDMVVDTWDQTQPTSACTWARVAAARVAVVARSNQYETKLDTTTGLRTCEEVTSAAPTWTGSTAAPIVLSNGSNWQCYRYRTFEGVTPIRNVIWMGAQSGC